MVTAPHFRNWNEMKWSIIYFHSAKSFNLSPGFLSICVSVSHFMIFFWFIQCFFWTKEIQAGGWEEWLGGSCRVFFFFFALWVIKLFDWQQSAKRRTRTPIGRSALYNLLLFPSCAQAERFTSPNSRRSQTHQRSATRLRARGDLCPVDFTQTRTRSAFCFTHQLSLSLLVPLHLFRVLSLIFSSCTECWIEPEPRLSCIFIFPLLQKKRRWSLLRSPCGGWSGWRWQWRSYQPARRQSTSTWAGSRTCTTAAAATGSLPSAWTSRRTSDSVTTWATTRCCCPTCWSTKPWPRWSSRPAAGCPWCTRTATRARRSSSARSLRPCAWRGPSSRAAGCARPCGTAAPPSWSRMASPGRRCSSVTSFPKTTCASPWRSPTRPRPPCRQVTHTSASLTDPLTSEWFLKGHHVNIYNINEVIKQTFVHKFIYKKPFSEENLVPEFCLKL